ncbi:class I adenylate-forming enzyme family protein [Aliiruegeria lutimaris]|uniref:Acyl-CoA synthetase (AMP-forming)/AMP-acid ligase II n=1 Tax=Aliiruegeria lutimaris TaxID=571298 RepID=A0A1G8KST9_9RHOB|nr:class I adenylate-forming enzyme family protein [Aliiruegeria lutimaris]SDI45980.1 Acyl-CoA synthetase (AMP-forming)/AMP-acid ligase II [Aliiruegeria lutimaris]
MLSIHADTVPPPPPAAFNMAAHVLAHAETQPDKTALAILSASRAARWRYGALAQAIEGIGAGLLAFGLTPGDRLLMRLGNEVEFPLAFLGAIWAGIVPIPASAALTVPEITRIAAETRPAAIVAAPDISLPDPCPCPVIPTLALREMETTPPCAPDLGDPNRPAYIIYTSGTSGKPRGVVHAHRAVWARQMMWRDWYDLRPDDRVLHAGAFNWTYTLGTGLLDPWAIGATALIPAAGTKPPQLPLLMRRHDATLFAAAPGVYRQMLRDAGSLNLPKLRHGLSAGEKLPARLRQAWEEATGRAVHEALGMSECSTYLSGSPSRPAPDGSSGYPQSGRRLAILGPNNQPVARETPGILAIHRDDPGLMIGYLDAPEETEARFAGDWFPTGDTARMAEDGAISYLGRDDDMMNAGGFRVSPLEVEAVLARFPGISEIACAEVEVKADTTVIGAFYTGPEELDTDALTAFASENLASYKCPRLYRQLDSLPRNANGKINRRALSPDG